MGEKDFLIERLKENAIGGIIYTDRVTIDFRQSKKEQIAKSFSIEELKAALIYINQNTKTKSVVGKKGVYSPVSKKTDKNELILKFKAMISGLEYTRLSMYEVEDYVKAFSDEDMKYLVKIGFIPDSYLWKVSIVAAKRKASMGVGYAKERSEKLNLTKKIFELAEQKGIEEIFYPFAICFKEEHVEYIAENYDIESLRDALEEIEDLQNFVEASTKLQIATNIFEVAKEKNIGHIDEPLIIDFDIDEPMDLSDNLDLIKLKELFLEINAMENISENANVLDVINLFKDGAVNKVKTGNEVWKKHIPSCLKKYVKFHMTLEQVYELSKIHVKNYQRDSKDYMKLMDFKCDLEEMIFNPEEFNLQQEEKFEFELNPIVRKTVEAIMMPQMELNRLLFEEGFSIVIEDSMLDEKLVELVRKRDAYKCVVCDDDMNTHLYFKIPINKGGPYHLDNMVTLCTSCYNAINTKQMEYAYEQCMKNFTKSMIPHQKVDYGEDLNILQQQALNQLEELVLKYSKSNQELAGELLTILQTIEYTKQFQSSSSK